MKDNMTFPLHRFLKNGSDVSPLIVLNQYQDDTDETIREIANITDHPFNLLAIHGLDWNNDLTPWPMGPIGKGDAARKGLADIYLGRLEELINLVKKENGLSPTWIGIAGYSLGGLFALYSGFKSNTFSRIASCSGSFWYEGFLPYCESHKLSEKVDRIYLSLGDKESRSKNHILATVEDNTKKIFGIIKDQGRQTTLVMNRGGHFIDAAKRTAMGIAYLLD